MGRLLTLTRVLQNGNGIGDRGAELLVEELKVNIRLQKLYLVRLIYILCFDFFVLWGKVQSWY